MPTTAQTFLQNISSAGTVIIDGAQYYAASWNGKRVRFKQQIIGEPNYSLKQAGITVRKVFNAGLSPVIANSYVSKTTGQWIFEFDAPEVQYGAWYVLPTRENTDIFYASIPLATTVIQQAQQSSAGANASEQAGKWLEDFFSWKNPIVKPVVVAAGVYFGGKILKIW